MQEFKPTLKLNIAQFSESCLDSFLIFFAVWYRSAIFLEDFSQDK
ncbi:MAG TPA: hypothetical protein VFE91_04375 [Nitrososphaerales archaeon]|nr:hypothetical protein [Nitrososphaerales archaeon]